MPEIEVSKKELVQTAAKRVRLTAEDKADIRAANRARKGDLVDWKDVKKELGLRTY